MTDSEGHLLRRYNALVGVIDQLIVTLNGAGEVVDVNVGSMDWLDASKMLSRTFSTLFTDELSHNISAQFDAALSSHEPQPLQLTLKPEHLLHWREIGLPEAQIWDTVLIAVSATELLWVAKNVTESRKLAQKVSHQAQRDPLTGAYNRRSLMTVLNQSVAQAHRYDWVCSFLLIDIDDFSGINDEYGWDAGDQVLQSFVTALHGFQRTADFFARYSDDRFVMFLPETNREQARLASERVRRLVEGIEIPFQTGNLKYTVCIGSSTLRDIEDTPETMLRRAEEHLFIAKQSGSNRIEGEAD